MIEQGITRPVVHRFTLLLNIYLIILFKLNSQIVNSTLTDLHSRLFFCLITPTQKGRGEKSICYLQLLSIQQRVFSDISK